MSQPKNPRMQFLVLGAVALALVSTAIVRRARMAAPVVKAARGPDQHPHFAPRHGPKVPQMLMAGLWRTDGGYRATIHVQNALMVSPLSVTPTLYMADGTPLTLPAVEIPASGTASVEINQALATAPAAFAGHISTFGSAALRYDWDSGGHLSAILMSKDAGRSLIHTTHFTPAPKPPLSAVPATAVDTMEMRGFDRALGRGGQAAPRRHMGLWWRHDAGVTTALTLLNAGDVAVTGRYRLNSEHGRDLDWHSVVLAPHAAEVVSLDREIAALPPGQQEQGGIEVEELAAPADDGGPPTPAWGALGVGGWLENPGEGFSGDMDWVAVMPPMGAAPATTAVSQRGPRHSSRRQPSPSGLITLAAAGIMVGVPMAGDKFPDGVVFRPYGYLRNTTQRLLQVDLALSLAMPVGMSGTGGMVGGAGAPPAASLPVELAPGETRAIDLDAWARRLQPAGGAMEGEMLNWSARFQGGPSDLLLTAGSVDAGGSYVFEVVPRQLAPSAGEQLPYWSTAEGDNTMYSLRNPGATVQDVMLHLTSADGAGDYEIPLHLVPGGSAMVDLGMIRAEGMPDMHGHLLPAGDRGSAMLEPAAKPAPGPDGVIVVPKGGLWSMQVVVSTGVFNPTTATCGDPCGSCCGYELPDVATGFIGGDGVGSTVYAQFEVWDCTGYPMDDTANASWSASSGLEAIGLVDGGMEFTAVTVGAQTVSGDDYMSVVPDSDFVCVRFCEQGDLSDWDIADVLPVISGPSSVWWFNGQSPSGYATQITLTTDSGSGYQWHVLSGGDEISTSSLTGSTLTISSAGTSFSQTPGAVSLSVTVNGETSLAFALTPRRPWTLVPGNIESSPQQAAFVDAADSGYGYDSHANYTIEDQTGSPLPSVVTINEQWSGDVSKDYTGTNWIWGTAGGTTTSAAYPAAFYDDMQGEPPGPPLPVPTPGYNGLVPTVKVINDGQIWRVGSSSSGAGVTVQLDTLQKYVNAARHEAITTPYNP
ncbi:MAG TPA: hypothetical protein VFP94_05690 [Terriglobales bacterium]|nr:hypothetical protein [Terriglobales bacterium]